MKNLNLIMASFFVCILFTTNNLSAQEWQPKEAVTINLGYGLQDDYLVLGSDKSLFTHFSGGFELRYYRTSNSQYSVPFYERLNMLIRYSIHACNFMEWEKMDVYLGYNFSLFNRGHGAHLGFDYYITDRIGLYARAQYEITDDVSERLKFDQSIFETQIGLKYALNRSQAKLDNKRFRS